MACVRRQFAHSKIIYNILWRQPFEIIIYLEIAESSRLWLNENVVLISAQYLMKGFWKWTTFCTYADHLQTSIYFQVSGIKMQFWKKKVRKEVPGCFSEHWHRPRTEQDAQDGAGSLGCPGPQWGPVAKSLVGDWGVKPPEAVWCLNSQASSGTLILPPPAFSLKPEDFDPWSLQLLSDTISDIWENAYICWYLISYQTKVANFRDQNLQA